MADFDLAVRGATVVRSSGRAKLDIYIRDGRIAALETPARARSAEREIDASGALVLPGGVDTHVHFMDPGDPSREDFPTGTAAAAARGVTTVVEHTHGWPVTDSDRLREKVAHLEGRANVDFGLVAHVWPDKLDQLEGLWRAGVTYFKAFTCETHGVPAIDADTMMELADRMALLGSTCLVHCEDDLLTARAEQRLREAGRSDGGVIPAWRSREAELVSVSVVGLAARRSGAQLIVAHASNAEVLDLIRHEREKGASLLAESCPQYLHLYEEEVLEEGAFRKFTPPARLRSQSDEERMWQCLNEGLIHHISSDHAPATAAQKKEGDIWSVHFGLPGIDTTYPVMISAALQGRTSLERVVESYCEAPARVYGIPGKGRIEVGYDADLAVVDPDGGWVIRDEDVISKAGWSPYAGRQLKGRVVLSMLRGEEAAVDGKPADARGGRFLPGRGAQRL